MDRERDVEKTLSVISQAEISGFDSINQRLSEKRLRWYEENKGSLNLQGSDVRKAFTLLMKYLEEVFGLDPREAPVVHEDKSMIVWRSYNWCPVLEACKMGNYDTREVCKRGWEKSVQALIERINPDLFFSRNYAELRPYGPCCEESIELRMHPSRNAIPINNSFGN